jgi:hypothetical protein
MSSEHGQLYLRVVLQIIFIRHITTLLYHLPFLVRCEPRGPQQKYPRKTFKEIRDGVLDAIFDLYTA